MSLDLIFECDYGNRTPVKNILKNLVSDYDANVIPMAAAFVNNNPYSLELFVVLSIESDYSSLKTSIVEYFNNVGGKRRTDLTLRDLMMAHGDRQFNSVTFLDDISVDLFFNSAQFFFAEREDLVKQSYTNKRMKATHQMFVSYSSKNEILVDDFVSVFNEKNISVWFDKNSIDYGETIISAIQKATDECIGVIFFITKDFLASNFCNVEMETFLTRYASNRDVLIVSIKDKNVSHDELPSFLRNIKYLDLDKYSDVESAVIEIVPSITNYKRKNYA